MIEYSPPPPSLSPPRAPTGLSILVGLAGLCTAICAASSGFFPRLAQSGRADFIWGDSLQYAAIIAFVGGVLALAKHEAGIPLVIGSSVVVVSIVATTVVALNEKLSTITDPFPVRGTLFLVGAATGAFSVVLGMVSLRGRAAPAFAAPVAILVLVSLAASGGILRIDKIQNEMVVRPFIGFALIAVVSLVCCFIGRYGVLAAVAASASIVASLITVGDAGGFGREAVLGVDIGACAAVVALGVLGVVVASRRVDVPPLSTVGWDGQAPGGVDPFASPQYPLGAAAATGQSPATQGQYEPTTAVAQQPAATVVDSGAVSTVGQWASDPYGRHQLRYWDGARWTEHVQTNGTSEIDPV